MDSELNNIHMFICHKTQPTPQKLYKLFVLRIIDWNDNYLVMFFFFLFVAWNHIIIYKLLIVKLAAVSKVGDRSQGRPESSLFNSYNTDV